MLAPIAMLAAVALAAPAATASDTPVARHNLSAFIPGAVSTDLNEYNLSISDDGRYMVFARSEADFRSAKIMVATRKGRGWSVPELIGFSDSRWRDSDPWLTPDGNTLYFVSDRPTAARPDKKDLDVWRSVRTKAGWGAPEHLGDVVNGAGEELGPELHDGVLYFATARRSGKGGLDVYAARLSTDGFAKPELLPGPINSAASESDFTLNRDGTAALFWRTVDGRGLIHLARRGADGSWSEPVPLPNAVNAGSFNFTPAFSRDGQRISFASNAARAGQPDGNADVYHASLRGMEAPTGRTGGEDQPVRAARRENGRH